MLSGSGSGKKKVAMSSSGCVTNHRPVFVSKCSSSGRTVYVNMGGAFLWPTHLCAHVAVLKHPTDAGQLCLRGYLPSSSRVEPAAKSATHYCHRLRLPRGHTHLVDVVADQIGPMSLYNAGGQPQTAPGTSGPAWAARRVQAGDVFSVLAAQLMNVRCGNDRWNPPRLSWQPTRLPFKQLRTRLSASL